MWHSHSMTADGLLPTHPHEEQSPVAQSFHDCEQSVAIVETAKQTSHVLQTKSVSTVLAVME